MINLTNKINSKINLVRFVKLSFVSDYAIKIWFGIGASDQENRLHMFISQSRQFRLLVNPAPILKISVDKH